MRQLLFSIVFAGILVLSLLTNWYAALSISLFSLLSLMVLHKIGKGIVLLEMSALFYVFTCLIMPVVGYQYYTYDNHLARLWVKYMPVDTDVYFNFSLPAVTVFCLAVTLPSFKKNLLDTGLQIKEKIVAMKRQLSVGSNKGLQIMITGVIVSVITKFLPASLNYFAILIFFASFAGLLYVYFMPIFKYKKAIILLFILFILGNALQSGMFTIVAYMGITIFSFFQVGKKASMLKKISVVMVGIVFLFVLQNVKSMYRKDTWKDTYQGSKVQLFTSLFADNLQKGSSLIGINAMFPIYTRTNQGYNVAMVMRRVPRTQNYDNGKRLLTVLASAFVPRFLWSDKPEAGGKFNMQYYAGIVIIGWSANVGTLGEAYGSFGVAGGILYMFLLGLFLRWVYFKVFILSIKIPLLICWLPVLFYDTTSSAETDTLAIINSIVKSAFFIWLLIKISPKWFGLKSNKNIRAIPARTILPAS